MSCVESRAFWITWESSHIRVGLGSYVGEGQFMDWRSDNTKDIAQAYFDTGDFATGRFKILNVEGKDVSPLYIKSKLVMITWKSVLLVNLIFLIRFIILL